MRLLTPNQVMEIERVLGRPLASAEREETSTLMSLSSEVMAVARSIAAENRMLAAKYLSEVVPGTRLGVVTTFLEDVVLGGRSPSLWDSQRPRRT